MTFASVRVSAWRHLRMAGVTASALLCLGVAPWMFGADQKVTTEDNSNNVNPAVAHLADGTTVYAWQGSLVGGGSGILARRFDAFGWALEESFLVNTLSGAQRRPTVQGDDSGGFVLVWRKVLDEGYGVMGRVFGSDGSPAGAEFQVNETAYGAYSMRPDLAVHDDGSFVVVWEAQNFDGSNPGIAGRRFDASGTALGPEFVANAGTAGAQTDPRVVIDGTGDFLVTWHDSGVRGRFFGSDGTPQTGDLVFADITNFINGSDVAMLPDGRFAVAYTVDPSNEINRIAALRRFDASGQPLEGQLVLSVDTTARKLEPAVAVHSDGTFHVVWESTYPDAAWEIFARTIAPDGTLEGEGALRVNQIANGNQREPNISVHNDGSAIYTWQGNVTGTEIYTNCESLGPCSIFADGFESGDALGWSSTSPP